MTSFFLKLELQKTTTGQSVLLGIVEDTFGMWNLSLHYDAK